MTINDIEMFLREEGFKYKFVGSTNVNVIGFSDPKDYRPGTLIWIGKIDDIVLTDSVDYSSVSLAFAKDGSDAEKYLPRVFLIDDPKMAFMRLVVKQYGRNISEYRGKNLIISETATIGENCYIGNNVVIEDGVKIGSFTKICDNSFIGKDSEIGSHCTIGQFVVIAGETNGSIYEDKDGSLRDMPNVGKVVIGNGVRIGAGSIIAKATFTETYIGDECELNAGTSIGHNCKIGKRVKLLGRCTISGNTSIGDNSQLVSSLVKNRVTVGKNAKVGIGSVVLKSIPDGKTCFGNPARIIPE